MNSTKMILKVYGSTLYDTLVGTVTWWYYNDFLLNRYEEGMYLQHSDVINIFGHCVFDEVVSGKNFYGIDTGCSYENKLTAIHLGTMKLYHEPMDERDSGYSTVSKS